MKEQDLGKYGGRVIRGFEGGGKKWVAGAILNPEDVEGWNAANKNALQSSGKVQWFAPPHPVTTDAVTKDDASEDSDNEGVGDTTPSEESEEEESEEQEEEQEESDDVDEGDVQKEETKPKSNRRRSPASKTKGKKK